MKFNKCVFVCISFFVCSALSLWYTSLQESNKIAYNLTMYQVVSSRLKKIKAVTF